jgi:hypothetical protein
MVEHMLGRVVSTLYYRGPNVQLPFSVVGCKLLVASEVDSSLTTTNDVVTSWSEVGRGSLVVCHVALRALVKESNIAMMCPIA